MLAFVLAIAAALPPNDLVPITAQCPALRKTWNPLRNVTRISILTVAEVDAEQAAEAALRACGSSVRDDEHALALMLIGDLDASFSERMALHGVVDPAQIHRQYWGLYDQVVQDAQHWSTLLRSPRSQQCGKLFVGWIKNERDDLWNHGTDPVRPLLAISRYTDRAELQCVTEVTGWKLPG